MHQHSNYRGPRRRREKERDEKIFEEIIVENFPNMGEEIGNLPAKEFRAMIVNMIQTLRNRKEKIQETFNKDLEELKSKQTLMNNTITEI